VAAQLRRDGEGIGGMGVPEVRREEVGEGSGAYLMALRGCVKGEMMDYERTDVDRARDLYAIICNGELGDDVHALDTRVNIVLELERITCADFKDTAGFHRTVGSFIMRESSGGDRLRRFRKSKRWSQGELAIHLGISQQFVAQMETGKRPLSDKALSLILPQTTLPYAPTPFACETGIDSKQDGEAKNDLAGPETPGGDKEN
jgi:DNA-binding XRE family transcriptional regulator